MGTETAISVVAELATATPLDDADDELFVPVAAAEVLAEPVP